MKFMILSLFGLTALCSLVAGGHLGGVDTVVKLDRAPNGFWQKKLIWKPRWMKSWAPKTVYVAHWKKVWGPVQLKEWVPIPKPPPGWVKPHANHVHHHHKVPVHVDVPVRTNYAPAHVDYIHQHRAPLIHAHKDVSIVNPEALHFHTDHGAHYGPAFGHHDHHHHQHNPNHLAHHHDHDHQHHEHGHHHHHEHIGNPNAENFAPHFLPLSLDHLKIK